MKVQDFWRQPKLDKNPQNKNTHIIYIYKKKRGSELKSYSNIVLDFLKKFLQEVLTKGILIWVVSMLTHLK